MDNSTDGLNILSIAVQEHSRSNSRSESNKKTQADCNIKSETIQKNERQTISHRQIEKRRRDRINNTLWMLKDLVPAAKRKFTSGSGRLEKADLLEMTIQHIKDVHRNLTTFEEKERKIPCGNTNVVNESYNNGFKDGMLQILDIMKKMNMLTQAQTELLMKESIMVQENNKQSELVKCNMLSDSTKANQPDLVVGSMGLSSLHSDCEMAKQDSENNPVNNINIEDITKCIKAEDLPVDTADSCSNFDGNCNANPRPFYENTESLSSAKSFPFHDGTFHKQTSLHVNNGTQNPILLPVYALHASGTHYVPVFLPPSSVLPTDPG